MITKTYVTKDRTLRTFYSVGSGHVTADYSSILEGHPETIRYPRGPKYSFGRCNWKPCVHTKDEWYSPEILTYSWDTPVGYAVGNAIFGAKPSTLSGKMPQFPNVSDGVKQCFNQIDLNTSDAVLAYSGIIQLVPLLGGVVKINSILRKMAKALSNGAKKQPFTTVVTSLISADFIDRFVIRPTIDDMHKVNESMNYVLNVVNTARERSTGPFALESGFNTIDKVTYTSSRTKYATNHQYVQYRYKEERYTRSQSKVFMLCEGSYDLAAIDPIKIWLNRTGITRPLDSAWDLVPFSFVLDYFARTGDFLSAISDEMGHQIALRGDSIRILDVWETRRAEHGTRWNITDILKTGPYGSFNFQSVRHEAFYKNQIFERRRVPAPWAYLLDSSVFPGEFIKPELTRTRTRTLAQLVLQAKLR